MTASILFVIPLVVLLIMLSLYGLNGQRELVKIDLVQFIYAFVMTPIVFIWLKSFLYFILRSELNVRLSAGYIFTIDTIFTTIFMYVFAFIVIHSLTKTFQLKTNHDPLYDMFHHSEYFHLWLTHLVTYTGAMFLTTFLGVMNAFIPLDVAIGKWVFHVSVASGVPIGLFGFIGIWLADPKQHEANFMRLMKIFIAIFFLILLFVQVTIDPSFDANHIFFWWIFVVFATAVVCSAIAYKSIRAQNMFERIVDKLTHSKGYKNIQLFKKRR